MRTHLGVFATIILVAAIAAGDRNAPLPANGVIPDEATAVKVAEAIFGPVFGEDYVAKWRPYHAQLTNGIWTVYGTLPPNRRGGTPMLKIQKRDGKVLEIWHSS